MNDLYILYALFYALLIIIIYYTKHGLHYDKFAMSKPGLFKTENVTLTVTALLKLLLLVLLTTCTGLLSVLSLMSLEKLDTSTNLVLLLSLSFTVLLSVKFTKCKFCQLQVFTGTKPDQLTSPVPAAVSESEWVTASAYWQYLSKYYCRVYYYYYTIGSSTTTSTWAACVHHLTSQ